MAAAALLLICTFYFALDRKVSSKVIFEEYYQAYDGVMVPRGDDDLLKEGIEAYNAEAYSKALDLLQEESDSDLTRGQRQLLIANCYLALSQPEKALEWLEKLSGSEGSNIFYNQQWYLALTYLLLDEPVKAKIILEKIEASNSIYAPKAKQLLEEPVFK